MAAIIIFVGHLKKINLVVNGYYLLPPIFIFQFFKCLNSNQNFSFQPPTSQ